MNNLNCTYCNMLFTKYDITQGIGCIMQIHRDRIVQKVFEHLTLTHCFDNKNAELESLRVLDRILSDVILYESR